MKSCEVKQKPKNLKELLRSKSFWITFAGVVIGGTAGYLYYHFAGCKTGTCAITGNPYSSVIFGSFIGFFVTNSPCGC